MNVINIRQCAKELNLWLVNRGHMIGKDNPFYYADIHGCLGFCYNEMEFKNNIHKRLFEMNLDDLENNENDFGGIEFIKKTNLHLLEHITPTLIKYNIKNIRMYYSKKPHSNSYFEYQHNDKTNSFHYWDWQVIQ